MKEKLLKALEEIRENYDAFFISNKYCDENLDTNTHKRQFDFLKNNLNGEYKMNALNWIKNNYDCCYKDDFPIDDKNNPFGYLKELIINLDL